MSTLYNLQAKYAHLLELASDPDVDPEVFQDTLEALEGEIETKAEGYAMVMKELEAQESAIKNEIDRLNKRQKTIANRVRHMKLSLQEAMEATGKTKFKTNLFSFAIANNPPTVVIDADITTIPEDYLKYKEPEIDKAKIREDIKKGIDIGIAHLEYTKSLRIR